MSASSSGGVTTRRQKKNREFEHVLSEIFAQDEDSPLRLALAEAHIQDVPSIVTLSSEDIDALAFPIDPGEGKVIEKQSLHPGHKNLIRVFQDYVHEQQEILQGNGIDQQVDILSLDPDDFDIFRINRYASRRLSGMSIHSHSTVAPSPLVNDPSTPTKSVASARYRIGGGGSVASFSSAGRQRNAAVKRDKNHYKDLTSDKFWDDWESSTRATARAHGCGQVLDPNYVPSTDEELVEFVDQQSFMYAVFTDKVQTLQGKRIVNKYKTTFDAQKVFDELFAFHHASLSSSNILTFLTSDRLDLDTWKFTTEDYVLVWLDKLRLYETLAPVGTVLQDATSKVMLQNAVSMVEKLNSVKDEELKELTYGRSPLSFGNYQTLLLSVCSTLDQHLARTRHTKPRHMSLMQAQELQISTPSPLATNFHDMVLSENDGTLQAYRSYVRGASMRGDTWKKLSKEGQSTWDQLSAEDKRLILDEAATRQSRQVSFHDLTHDPAPDNPDSGGEEPQLPSNVADTPSLEVMAHGVLDKKASPTPPPGNVHRLLGKQPSADKPAARSGHNVTYLVNNRRMLKPFGSLVDRGANGGIAGDDVRIITKTDRCIDVSGIDSHEVTDLPIVSVGGVAQSQMGEVILVFHQYASLGRGKTIHSALQLESYGTAVLDVSLQFNPQGQRLTTAEGYVFPLDFIHGLPYLPIRPYTDLEWDTLP